MTNNKGRIGNRVARADNEYQYGYTYDATYRVTQCLPTQNMQGPLFQQSTENFTYDTVGNRLTGPAYTKPIDYGIDYFYGYENRLVEVDNYHGSYVDTITFKYDPFGRRIEKNVDTVENGVPTIYNYTYVYDNEDIILEVLAKTQNGVTATTTTSYVHGPGIDEPLSLVRNGQTYYYHADGLGSITSMTDSAQAVVNRYAYDSFGALKKFETVRNTYSFTGREYDSETGLYLFRARYYDPETGKFVSKDPIGFNGGDVNVYNYVGNRPINNIDPMGLETILITTYDRYGLIVGSHSALYINTPGKAPFLYDPAGSYMALTRGSSGILEGEEANLQKYIKYQKETGSEVDLVKIPTTPAQEKQIKENADKIGDKRGLTCAWSVSSALNGICGIDPTWLPGSLERKAKSCGVNK